PLPLPRRYLSRRRSRWTHPPPRRFSPSASAPSAKFARSNPWLPLPSFREGLPPTLPNRHSAVLPPAKLSSPAACVHLSRCNQPLRPLQLHPHRDQGNYTALSTSTHWPIGHICIGTLLWRFRLPLFQTP